MLQRKNGFFMLLFLMAGGLNLYALLRKDKSAMMRVNKTKIKISSRPARKRRCLNGSWVGGVFPFFFRGGGGGEKRATSS